MKKYIMPATQVINITVGTIIATSQVEDGFSTDTDWETDETSGNLSRRRNNVWDDEEEDEEEQY